MRADAPPLKPGPFLAGQTFAGPRLKTGNVRGEDMLEFTL